ncbi:recombinase family protein [Leisingera sp. S232]|uniref:recombinase family protein n=1 Tax=Leisingera sp. S232 TaxID=3415132 RepID=UPI003C79F54F
MEAKQQAVIYCRVSSVAQLKKGDGLASQESRCREYARYKGYDILEIFNDNKSGGDASRPAMMALLEFLSSQKETCVVIIDDINRFARDVVGHWQLRAMLAEAGGKLESPSIEFGDDSDSILVENLLASVSQHQRQKNGEQTKNRMRGRALTAIGCSALPSAISTNASRATATCWYATNPWPLSFKKRLRGLPQAVLKRRLK